MPNPQLRQIEGYEAHWVGLDALASGTASTLVVTTNLTTALNTAGKGGTVVPLQVAQKDVDGQGVFAAPPHNIVVIKDSTTKLPIAAGGNEVYGRLSESSGVWTLSYYTLVNGVETAHTFGSSTNIDLTFAYQYLIGTKPTTAGITRNAVTQDISAAAGTVPTFIQEVRTPTATNTVPNLTYNPTANDRVKLLVNNVTYTSLGGDFSVASKAITWLETLFDLETTDEVIAEYFTTEV